MLKRSGFLRRRGIIKGKPVRVRGVADARGEWVQMRVATYQRDGGRCYGCGLLLSEWECHHRQLRSQGGKNQYRNLITLCHGCHDFAHLNRAWAHSQGLILHRSDPHSTPVRGHDGAWTLLVDGTRIPYVEDPMPGPTCRICGYPPAMFNGQPAPAGTLQCSDTAVCLSRRPDLGPTP